MAKAKADRTATETAPRPRLHFGRLKLATGTYRHHFADIPTGTDPAMLLEPDYWEHLSRVIRPLDKIEAFCEDGTWEAMFRVMFVGRAEIRLSPIYEVHHDQTKAGDLSSDLHEVRWISPSKKWGVVRRDTGAVIRDELYPKSQAVAFLQHHLSKLKD